MTSALERIFSPDGALGRALPGFQLRAGQLAMAQLVEAGFSQREHTIVEAGTGVGKSLAYLVPAVRARKKVVVSTGTIALQEQLVRKDIPLVRKALDAKVRVTLLKGRNHYLCKQKFEGIRADRLIPPSRSMQRLWEWADRTKTGDRAELSFVPPSDDWERLDADADDCVGEHCEHFRDCYFFQKRDEARYADLIVVNHALFFADLAVGGGLLPPYDAAVLDEAHQCERWATDALTVSLSRAGFGRMLRKLHRVYNLPAEFDGLFESGIRDLEAALARVPGDRYPLGANDAVWVPLETLRDALHRLENWLFAHWQDGLKRRPESQAEAERRRDLGLRSIGVHSTAIERANAPPDQAIAWAERNDADGRYVVRCAPRDVAQFLRDTLFTRVPSVVLTSATIALNFSGADEPVAPFAFLKRMLGIDEAAELIAPSPFDFDRQARLFVAPAQLNPKSPEFARRAAPLVEECLDRTSGRAFVLFTSYARLREVYALVRGRIAFPVRLQGELPRMQLLDWFRHTPNAVLFGTGTFWEGIDVVGDALSCVIIDRLPFPTPSDPLVMARIAALEQQGLRGFEHYMIPAATVRLKQGFGRLIRSRTDRGVVALLDGRAASTRYGSFILSALPPARRITHLDELEEFFSDVPLERTAVSE